jgi:hypothetical protein
VWWFAAATALIGVVRWVWSTTVRHSVITAHLHVNASRGNKLEDVGEISKNLASESKKYNWGAKQLSAMVSAPPRCSVLSCASP